MKKFIAVICLLFIALGVHRAAKADALHVATGIAIGSMIASSANASENAPNYNALWVSVLTKVKHDGTLTLTRAEIPGSYDDERALFLFLRMNNCTVEEKHTEGCMQKTYWIIKYNSPDE